VIGGLEDRGPYRLGQVIADREPDPPLAAPVGQLVAGAGGCRRATGDEADRLHGLLAQLPDAQSEVITLAFYGQLSHTEIAEQLGLPAGTVKGRMRLGLLKLRANIEP